LYLNKKFAKVNKYKIPFDSSSEKDSKSGPSLLSEASLDPSNLKKAKIKIIINTNAN